MLAAGLGISAWISALCPRPHASCRCAAVSLVMKLLHEEFPGGKAAVHLLVYTAQGHPRETLEKDRTGAFSSLNNCSIKYWWIYTIVDWADDSTNPFVNKFQSFSRSVVLSAGWQALISLLAPPRIPDVNHLFINTLLTPVLKIFCIPWQWNQRTCTSYRRGTTSPLQRLVSFENPFCDCFCVMQSGGWLLCPCCLTAFMVCSPGPSHSP